MVDMSNMSAYQPPYQRACEKLRLAKLELRRDDNMIQKQNAIIEEMYHSHSNEKELRSSILTFRIANEDLQSKLSNLKRKHKENIESKNEDYRSIIKCNEDTINNLENQIMSMKTTWESDVLAAYEAGKKDTFMDQNERDETILKIETLKIQLEDKEQIIETLENVIEDIKLKEELKILDRVGAEKDALDILVSSKENLYKYLTSDDVDNVESLKTLIANMDYNRDKITTIVTSLTKHTSCLMTEEDSGEISSNNSHSSNVEIKNEVEKDQEDPKESEQKTSYIRNIINTISSSLSLTTFMKSD